jgi:hypothetical protein
MYDIDPKLDLDKPVDFTYPEGFEEAAAALDFLPDDETRRMMVTMVTSGMLQ